MKRIAIQWKYMKTKFWRNLKINTETFPIKKKIQFHFKMNSYICDKNVFSWPQTPRPKECRNFLEKGCLLSTNRKQLLLMASAMSFNVLKVFFCDTRPLIWVAVEASPSNCYKFQKWFYFNLKPLCMKLNWKDLWLFLSSASFFFVSIIV